MPKLVSERIKKLREEIAEISEANRTQMHRRDGGQPPTKNGGSNDCRKFWMSLWPSLTGKSLKPFFALDVPRALASSAVLDGRKSRTGRRSSSKPPQVSPWNSHNSAPQSEHCLPG